LNFQIFVGRFATISARASIEAGDLYHPLLGLAVFYGIGLG
jgi:hypothetical protein